MLAICSLLFIHLLLDDLANGCPARENMVLVNGHFQCSSCCLVYCFDLEFYTLFCNALCIYIRQRLIQVKQLMSDVSIFR